ncbi:MAG: hypothetical protein IMF12_06865 [Proteobacteria bacterium]|nr:hypothetical protein [Pseudomonadota bacterium]
MLRVSGLLLFVIGVILALISAAKLPADNTNWSDMLPLYSLAVLLACSGLLLYYRSQSYFTNSSSTFLCSNVVLLLQELILELNKLEIEIFNLDTVEIANRVNILLNNYVLPCVATKQEIIKSLGNHKGSEVLVHIAQGERLLNRIWSAASDEKIQEIYITYPNISYNFEEAYHKCINCETKLLIFQQIKD